MTASDNLNTGEVVARAPAVLGCGAGAALNHIALDWVWHRSWLAGTAGLSNTDSASGVEAEINCPAT